MGRLGGGRLGRTGSVLGAEGEGEIVFDLEPRG